MTTCSLSLAELPSGRKDVQNFRYHGYPQDRLISFPSFDAGLAELWAFGIWAEENRLVKEIPDHVTYVVVCKRSHLLDFWKRCYEGKSELWVSKEVAWQLLSKLEALNPRKLYALIAYEY